MIKNIGVDIIENERFADFIDNEQKLKKILSDEEIKQLQAFTAISRKLEYIAGRFASKEALRKAGLKFNYPEASILNREDGSPYLVYESENEFMISISHNKTMTVAFVVMIEPCFANI